jgi:hypothetical protein
MPTNLTCVIMRDLSAAQARRLCRRHLLLPVVNRYSYK